MDTLYWNKKSPGMIFEETIKQYYGKYLWRLVISAPGVRLLESTANTLEEALLHRREINKNYNWAGSWRTKLTDDNVDLNLIKKIQEIKLKYGSVVRFRMEEPLLQVYAENEITLKLVASELGDQYLPNICSVSGPSSSEAEEILRSGAIIRRKPTEFGYKVILKDGRYSTHTKLKILNYLDNLGDVVKLSTGCRGMLNKPYPSMWSVFFYTKDPGVTTFLTLIEPGIISNIHPLVNREQ
jgi:hypothetical protein